MVCECDMIFEADARGLLDECTRTVLYMATAHRAPKNEAMALILYAGDLEKVSLKSYTIASYEFNSDKAAAAAVAPGEWQGQLHHSSSKHAEERVSRGVPTSIVSGCR